MEVKQNPTKEELRQNVEELVDLLDKKKRELTKNQDALAAVTLSHEAKEKELLEVSSVLESKQKQVDDLVEETETVRTGLNKTVEELAETDRKLIEANANLVKLEESLHKAQEAVEKKELELLDKHKRLELDEQKAEDLRLLIGSRTTELANLGEDLDTKKEERSVIEKELVSGRSDLEELTNEISHEQEALRDERDTLEKVVGEVVAKQQELKEVLLKVQNAREQVETVLGDLEAQKEFTLNELKSKKEESDKREGLISEKMQWLSDKEDLLREAKKALERHLNKKLDDVII